MLKFHSVTFSHGDLLSVSVLSKYAHSQNKNTSEIELFDRPVFLSGLKEY
jgi:hypothetical protein